MSAPESAAARVADAIDDYLLVWVLAAVGIGLLVPRIAALTPLSTAILAVMIGSISLTLSPAAFRAVDPGALATILVVQTGMPIVAFGVARLLALSPTLTVGFVVLGAVTPELVAPVMTDLGGGDTALATAALVLVGVGTLVLVPGAVLLLVGGDVAASLDTRRIVEQLLLAVVGPMAVAVALRARFPSRVGTYDRYYPSVSALMVVLILPAITSWNISTPRGVENPHVIIAGSIIIGIVAAANADLVWSNGRLVVTVGVGAVVLNGLGYAGGWLSMLPFDRSERIAGLFSVRMRDFAVAAALVVSAGLPTAAALPAVVFGIVEMSSSAGLARLLRRSN